MDPLQTANHRRWEEQVALHLKSDFYGVDRFLTGQDMLYPIEAEEIGDVRGQHIAHLQCHFGLDTLCLARRGAIVTGLDYSGKAIAAAQDLARRSGLSATFVEADVYTAADVLTGPFDMVYVTWGAINWLPDISRWARTVADLLRPGGRLYLLETHPAAQMLDEREGQLVPTYDYFGTAEPVVFEQNTTYTGQTSSLTHQRIYQWTHSIGDVLNALIRAQLNITVLQEHQSLPYKLFPMMQADEDRMFVLPPNMPALPLSYSVQAVKSHGL